MDSREAERELKIVGRAVKNVRAIFSVPRGAEVSFRGLIANPAINTEMESAVPQTPITRNHYRSGYFESSISPDVTRKVLVTKVPTVDQFVNRISKHGLVHLRASTALGTWKVSV